MMQEKESGRILQCIGGIYTVATDSGTVSSFELLLSELLFYQRQ